MLWGCMMTSIPYSLYPMIMNMMMQSIPSSVPMAIEPCVTIRRLGTIRLEDDHLTTPSESERLTKAPIVDSVS